MKKRILLIGGGSGGHIMPNLAIAEILCGSDGGSNCGPASRGSDGGVELLYVGSRLKLDRELVKSAGIKFKAIFTGKLRRYFSLQNFIDPFFVIIGFFQSLWILIRFWPNVVFSKGGFVSLPVVFAAFVLRRPIILHESDSVMGLANRITSRLANKVCVSFPVGTQNFASLHGKTIFTGNPIRLEIQNGNPDTGYKLTGFHPKKPVLLVWGGSLGAQQINEMIGQEFDKLKSVFQIIHITGKGKQTEMKDETYIQYEYIGDELKHIYAITNVVFSRAGANSLYELALMEKPNILLPIQKADQVNNAKYFASKGASIILRDQPLHAVLDSLWHNKKKMEDMKKALADLAKPNATEEIAELILST